VVPKASLFASKQRYLLQEQKSYSLLNQLNCYSLLNQLNYSYSLLNQLNCSLAAAENTEDLNASALKDKDLQVRIAINKTEQLLRRKRFFNPNSQKVSDSTAQKVTAKNALEFRLRFLKVL
jgi:hypothetical protein